jgi:hypothetical protein
MWEKILLCVRLFIPVGCTISLESMQLSILDHIWDQ